MSGQPFSFPPPPPPPPKRTVETPYQQNQNQGYQNGRGAYRGSNGYRGNARGSRGNPNSHRGGHSTSSTAHGVTWSNTSRPPRGGSYHNPQKRDYNTAFQPHHQQPSNYRPRPLAPPAVPDFNAPIQHILARSPPAAHLPQKPSVSSQTHTNKPNGLGLTPAKFEQDSDPEDDVDEEQRLASQPIVSAAGAYLFEYNGNPLTLHTREDILAWVAERRRRFPTEAKREAAKKEAEEKKRQRDTEMQARLQARKDAQMQKNQDRAAELKSRKEERKAQAQKPKSRPGDAENVDDATRAKLKAEKLRKKAAKAQKQLEEAEEALRLAQANDANPISPPSLVNSTEAKSAPAPDASDATIETVAIDDDQTSSSGSSLGDSDSNSDTGSASESDQGPEVTSTKTISRDLPPSTASDRKRESRTPKLCMQFKKYKHCKYGSNCRYSHDLSRERQKTTSSDGRNRTEGSHVQTTASGNAKRKGLWQVMVEKEQEEERKRLLTTIITLGERGMLDEPATKADGTA